VSQLHVSADGRWAAQITHRAAHLFNLESLEYHGQLPPFEVSRRAMFESSSLHQVPTPLSLIAER
jgi:hypothetical protein